MYHQYLSFRYAQISQVTGKVSGGDEGGGCVHAGSAAPGNGAEEEQPLGALRCWHTAEREACSTLSVGRLMKWDGTLLSFKLTQFPARFPWLKSYNETIVPVACKLYIVALQPGCF